eukprot:Colp12_sorted_trinity150504_noHs@12409
MDLDDIVAPGESELSLPKATIYKLIKEMLPNDIKMAGDARDLISECCTEFVHLISSEANAICTKENKKTILAEHVLTALKTLGFEDYIEECKDVLKEHNAETQKRQKASTKLEKLGIPEEQLLQEQMELFAEARRAQQAQMHAVSSGLELP